MAKVSINEVADWFIWRSHEVGDPITNLKLQKLVYYAQAWHLALTGEKLFDDEFQAWVHGPVNSSLYQRFKAYRWHPLAEDINPPALPAEVVAHLEEVMVAYGGHSAWDLERLTHTEAPWLKARAGCAADENCETVISSDGMRDYYRSLIQDGER